MEIHLLLYKCERLFLDLQLVNSIIFNWIFFLFCSIYFIYIMCRQREIFLSYCLEEEKEKLENSIILFPICNL